MAKYKAGKVALTRRTGDLDADLMLHQYRAGKRLASAKKDRRWQLAAAAATDRFLLIGKPER